MAALAVKKKKQSQNPAKKASKAALAQSEQQYMLSKEQVEQALKLSFSNLSAAARVFTYPDGKPIPRQTFCYWMDQYGIDPYAPDFRTNMMRVCVDTLLTLAVKEKRERSLFKILETWGQQVGFEPPAKKVDVTTKKGNPYVLALKACDPAFSDILLDSEDDFEDEDDED